MADKIVNKERFNLCVERKDDCASGCSHKKCFDKLPNPSTPKPDEVVEGGNSYDRQSGGTQPMNPITQETNEIEIKVKGSYMDYTKHIYGMTAHTNEIYINPTQTSELIAWARSKALEFVEIDTNTIEMIAMKYISSTKTPQWLVDLILEVYEQNPIKLKTK